MKVDRCYDEPVKVDAFYTGGLRNELDHKVGVGDIFVKDDNTALMKTRCEWTELLNSL